MEIGKKILALTRIYDIKNTTLYVYKIFLSICFTFIDIILGRIKCMLFYYES